MGCSETLSVLQKSIETEKNYELLHAELLFEQIQKGWRHPDGSVKTLKNMHEKRTPRETCH